MCKSKDVGATCMPTREHGIDRANERRGSPLTPRRTEYVTLLATPLFRRIFNQNTMAIVNVNLIFDIVL